MNLDKKIEQLEEYLVVWKHDLEVAEEAVNTGKADLIYYKKARRKGYTDDEAIPTGFQQDSFHKDSFHQNTEEENRIIQILNDTLSSLVSQYEDYKRYSDTNPTFRLYRETETSILKAIQKIDGRTPIDRNFP